MMTRILPTIVAPFVAGCEAGQESDADVLELMVDAVSTAQNFIDGIAPLERANLLV